MDSNCYYTTAAYAAQALKERTGLRGRVEGYWLGKGWGLPPLLPEVQSCGVMARQLASFRYEDAAFVRLCETVGLTPIWPAWKDDKMVPQSNLKTGYISPRYIDGRRNKRSEPIIRGSRTLTGKGWSGKKLSEVTLERIGGKSLVDFHLEQQDRCMPGALRCDVSDWYNGISYAERYVALISMFVAHGALFDDYHGGESAEAQIPMTQGRFEPAFAELEKVFGVRPLIILLPWHRHLGCYPTGEHWRTDGILDEYFDTL